MVNNLTDPSDFTPLEVQEQGVHKALQSFRQDQPVAQTVSVRSTWKSWFPVRSQAPTSWLI